MHSTQSITSLRGVYTWKILILYLGDRVFRLLINGWRGGGGGGGENGFPALFHPRFQVSLSRPPEREGRIMPEKVGVIKISHIEQIVTKPRPN